MKIPLEYVEAYKRQEITIYGISQLMNKSPSTVYHALRTENVNTSYYRSKNKERNEKIIYTYKTTNKPLREVGEMFGISKQRVEQIVKKG